MLKKMVYTQVPAVVLFIVSLSQAAVWEDWSKSYYLKDSVLESGSDITVDIAGNIYVTGLKCDPSDKNSHRYSILRKINAEGSEIWNQVCETGTGELDYSNSIAVDGLSNIYVAGYETVNEQDKNIWIRKYSPDGNVLWIRTYNNPEANLDDAAKDVAVDGLDNAIVAGYETTSNGDKDAWIRKYDREGKELWTRTYSNGLYKGDEEADGVAVDNNGNVYVVGYEILSGSSRDIWIKKYDKSGSELWMQSYSSYKNTGNTDESRIAVDTKGNVYISGFETMFYQGNTPFLRKYDTNGKYLFYKQFPNPDYYVYEGNNIITDGNDNVYISIRGGFYGGKSVSWIEEDDVNGSVILRLNYEGKSQGIDICPKKNGDIYVLGREVFGDKSANIWVKKYVQVQADTDSRYGREWQKIYNSKINAKEPPGISAELELDSGETGTAEITCFVKGNKNRVDITMPLSMANNAVNKLLVPKEQLLKIKYKTVYLDDGKNKWIITGIGRRQIPEGDMYLNFNPDALLGSLKTLNGNVLKNAIISNDTLNNTPCYVISYSLFYGDEERRREWINKDSLETAQMEINFITAGVLVTAVDYRKPDAINYALKRRILDIRNGRSYEYKTKSFKINMNLEDSLFDPNNIKIEEPGDIKNYLGKLFRIGGSYGK